MINLLVNCILFVLRLLNFLSFGILDNIAVVYSILIVTSFIVFVKLDATIGICDIWKKTGAVPRGLIITGLTFNALPQWYLWLIGLCFIALAYFLTPNPNAPKKANKKPSLFAKIKDVVMEEYHESDFKKNASKKLEDFKKNRKLPPV